MTGFPVCGTLTEFMKFVWGREGCFLFTGRIVIASKCNGRRVKARLMLPGNSKRAEYSSSYRSVAFVGLGTVGLFSPLLPPCTRAVTGFVTGLFSLHSPAAFSCVSCFFPFPSLSVGRRHFLSHTCVIVLCPLPSPLPTPQPHLPHGTLLP